MSLWAALSAAASGAGDYLDMTWRQNMLAETRRLENEFLMQREEAREQRRLANLPKELEMRSQARITEQQALVDADLRQTVSQEQEALLAREGRSRAHDFAMQRQRHEDALLQIGARASAKGAGGGDKFDKDIRDFAEQVNRDARRGPMEAFNPKTAEEVAEFIRQAIIPLGARAIESARRQGIGVLPGQDATVWDATPAPSEELEKAVESHYGKRIREILGDLAGGGEPVSQANLYREGTTPTPNPNLPTTPVSERPRGALLEGFQPLGSKNNPFPMGMVETEEDLKKLKKGAWFITPDGRRARK